jgi:hypothetical protein
MSEIAPERRNVTALRLHPFEHVTRTVAPLGTPRTDSRVKRVLLRPRLLAK